MRPTRFLLCLALVGAACADVAGVDPGSPASPPESELISDVIGDAEAAATTITDQSATWLRYRSNLSLETFDTTLAVIQGQASHLVIRFLNDPIYGSERVFMELEIPASARFVGADGESLRAGDSVDLTVRIDPRQLLFTFGPHGSRFADTDPAVLRVFHDCTEHDLLTNPALRLWYQASAESAWTLQDNAVDVVDGYAVAALYHFSNYAMAF